MSKLALTPREKEVLICRCGRDLDANATALALGIARNTVFELGNRAKQRLGVRSIAAACFRLGLMGSEMRERNRLAVVARDGERIA